MNCRHCGAHLSQTMIDLGSAPPSNAYLTTQTLHMPERWLPLKVLVCTQCWLAQTEDTTTAEMLFDAEYAYYSSFSRTWLDHAKRYVQDMRSRFALDSTSYVIEVAANDGYLLQYVQTLGIPCLGIEPTSGTAAAARAKGLPIIEQFFGRTLAELLVVEGHQADLTIANNVLAHVPDINDFITGFKVLLKPSGVATFEFPHLLELVEKNQFDTIYHEHFSYLSLTATLNIFNRNGLEIFDVKQLSTHGGSLRIYAQRKDSGPYKIAPRVSELLRREKEAGLLSEKHFTDFQPRANKVKNDLLLFLINAKESGKRVVAYGAAAKGNTLLNYCGIRPDLLPYVVDMNPVKQGKFMPGSRIPILAPEQIQKDRPDYILILPWNIRQEVIGLLDYAKGWGCKFVTAIPRIEIL
ncbi:SAM-dependent methyltransferase [Halothiobacillus diazotrophicus]|uniref:SAM-dependent methyltransferase n=1 Tax=Halothiobacillus diazotrophicus TaxID=1860122 RepID=A0A191ZIM6_9GAMM|nr:class I SAM-dependent methyltransferase [Halothiobacillus diazotrophicus]ANJ67715.1 SAM-dependent methyltransferase [Halothiobacillus diazotrophicus]